MIAEPRVLVISNMWPRPEDPIFGIFVAQQVEDLRALGLEIEIFFVDGRASKANYLRGIRSLRHKVRSWRPDLLHAHHALSASVALASSLPRSRPPLLVTHHGIEVFAGWQAWLSRWVTRRADRTLVVSPAMARRLALPSTSVLPCGIDLAAFRPGDKQAARAALGLPPELLLVAWVGVDRPEKRLALARAAMRQLQRSLPEAHLHVVTDLPPGAVPEHLQACDALILSSTEEGSPMVVKEALACGLPVVGPAVGDLPELLEGLPGCAVVDAEPDVLAEALALALAAGPVDARSRLAAYDRRAVARRLRAIYHEMAGGA